MQKFFLITTLLIATGGCSFAKADGTGNLIVHAEDDSYVWHWTLKSAFGKDCAAIDAVSSHDSYREIDVGSQVVVKSADGKVLATGLIGKGKIADLSFYGSCKIPFTVKGIPAADFYEFAIGSKKGAVVSRQQLESNNWQIDLTALPDSLHISPKIEVSEEKLKEWKAARAIALSSEKLEFELSKEKENAERESLKTKTCVTQRELQEQWNGDPISEECKKLLQDLKI